ncbi:ABC transporter substrate-binding protein [Agrobacterium tumefaciens]|uniref:ABC transporter substrate-binding protein n=1 Tax=Agrobacterium tumefaciens TaxID=358 RepID=UPI001574C768|nr:ABC transporter substrate-binding protein [Agrobacterium tumefaciens]NSX89170.1 ABC transporter substrate-binding protein [Agrobacterium tumefaciens]
MMKRLYRIVSLALATATLFGAPAWAQSVTWGTDGGALHDVMTKTLVEPAEKKLGIRIVSDQNSDRYPVVKAQVLSGKPQWDLFDGAAGYCARGKAEGLLEPLDYSLIPNAKHIPEAFKDEAFIGLAAYATVLAWNTDTFGDNGPKTWADFFDVEKFPGRRAMRNYARPMLEIALLADGVAPKDLYPLDVDRAYAKLEKIKPHVAVWWTSGAETTQLLFDGEVDMIPLWDGRAGAAIEEGAPANFTRNEAIMEYSCIAALKGTANRDNTMKFINELLDAKGQADWANEYLTGPLNTEFAQHISAERLPKLTTAPENLKVQVPLNATWWASKDGEEAERRWLAFMQK